MVASGQSGKTTQSGVSPKLQGTLRFSDAVKRAGLGGIFPFSLSGLSSYEILSFV